MHLDGLVGINMGMLNFGWLGGKRISSLERDVAGWMERSHRLEEQIAELLFERDKLWGQVATWRHAANKRLDGINELEALVEQLNMQIESLTKKDQQSQDIINYLTHELSVSQYALESMREEKTKPAATKTVKKAVKKKK